jgi:hypothetical protein
MCGSGRRWGKGAGEAKSGPLLPPPPASSLRTPPASPPPGHPPQRQLRSAAIIPPGSFYYTALHLPLTPRREVEVTGVQRTVYGQDVCAKRIWRSLQPMPVHADATVLEPGWTPAKRRGRSSHRAPPAAPQRDRRLDQRSSAQSGRPTSAALQAFVKATAGTASTASQVIIGRHTAGTQCAVFGVAARDTGRSSAGRCTRPLRHAGHLHHHHRRAGHLHHHRAGHLLRLRHPCCHRQAGLAATTLDAVGVLLTTTRIRGVIMIVAATAM